MEKPKTSHLPLSADYLKKNAASLGRSIDAGEVDPVQLTQAYLNAIEDHPDSDRIYARVTPERALKEATASASRAKSGTRLSPLDGVPISWKDLFDTAGVGTEAGSGLLKGRIPSEDAEVLQNAAAAGLVCLGKTHMSELAFSGLGYNPSTQTPACINDQNCVAGGSSSGAAASVANGLAACAVGSDTGGSIRIPAAWNDLVGLKTTHGRLSLSGVVPLCQSFDSVGPLCHSVEDAMLMLAILQGEKAQLLQESPLSGKRFLILNTIAMDDLAADPATGFNLAIEKLKGTGAIIETADIPEVADAMALAQVLYTTEAYAYWKDSIEANPSAMFSEIVDRFRAGANFSGVEYLQGWLELKELRKAFYRKTKNFSAILVPTTPNLPPRVDRINCDKEAYVSENLLALRNTRIGNLMNSATLTIPTGIASCGLSVMMPPMSEEKLLAIGSAIEKICNNPSM